MRKEGKKKIATDRKSVALHLVFFVYLVLVYRTASRMPSGI